MEEKPCIGCLQRSFFCDNNDSYCIFIESQRASDVRRPSFPYIYMRLAEMISNRSTCNKKSVGCVITSADYNYVYAVGYNGNFSGGPNACDFITYRGDGCGCIHAEINALIRCTVLDRNKVMFSTVAPCPDCAKVIVNSGFKKVFYRDDWENDLGIQILKTGGIEVEKETNNICIKG